MKKIQIAFLEELEASLGNIWEACKTVGISRLRVYKMADNDPVFAEKLWEISEGFLDLAESTNLKLGIAGDGRCLSKYLDAKGENRGYGGDKSVKKAYSVLPKLPREDDKVEFKNEIKEKPTEDIKEQLKNLKKIIIKKSEQ